MIVRGLRFSRGGDVPAANELSGTNASPSNESERSFASAIESRGGTILDM
jgi:hypothetical protein